MLSTIFDTGAYPVKDAEPSNEAPKIAENHANARSGADLAPINDTEDRSPRQPTLVGFGANLHG